MSLAGIIANHLQSLKYEVHTDNGWAYMTEEDVQVVLDTLTADLYNRESGDSIEHARLVLTREADQVLVYVRVGEIPLGEK